MNQNNNDKKTRLQELKYMIYSRALKKIKEKRSKLSERKVAFKDSWPDSSEGEQILDNPELYSYRKDRPNLFSLLFVFSLIFFVLAFSFAVLFLYFNQDRNLGELQMSVLAPNTVDSGQVFEYTVKLENNTRNDFYNISLISKFPEGSLDPESQDFTKNKTFDITEPLLSGGVLTKKFRVILTGFEGQKKDIEITLLYQTKGYTGMFSKKMIYSVGINKAPVGIDIEAPKKVLSGQDFDFKVKILSNTDRPYRNLIFRMKSPNGYVFRSSVPKAREYDDINGELYFFIKELKPAEALNLDLKGHLSGQNGENKFFTFEVGTVDIKNAKIKTTLFRAEKDLKIKKPDVSIDITSTDGKKISKGFAKPFVVLPDKRVKMTLVLTNNLNSKISNLELVIDLPDKLIQKSSVSAPYGYYDSNDNKIIWNKNTMPDLVELEALEDKELEFEFRLKNLESIAGYFKDPEIPIKISLKGVSFDSSDSESEISVNALKKVQIASDVGIDSFLLYSEGPFENKGPVNPRVGEVTTYTVVWQIYNASSEIKDVEMKAKLPYGVTFLEKTSPGDAYVLYNPDTREVVWKLKKVEPFIGYRTDPKTLYFQISYEPTVGDVNKYPVLVEKKILTAKDTFVDEKITVIRKADTTAISRDKMYSRGMGMVKDR